MNTSNTKILPVSDAIFQENLQFVNEHTKLGLLEAYPIAVIYTKAIAERLKDEVGAVVLRELFSEREIEEFSTEIMIAVCFLLRNKVINALIEAEPLCLDSAVWLARPTSHTLQREQRASQAKLLHFTLKKGEK